MNAAIISEQVCGKNDEKKIILATCYLTVLFTSIVFSSIIYFGSNDISEMVLGEKAHANLIRLAPFILSFDALSLIPLLLLRAQNRSTLFIVIKIVAVVINLGLNVIFVLWMNLGIVGVFYAQAISSLVLFVITLLVVAPYFKFTYAYRWLKEMLSFGLPYLPTTFAVILMELIDRYFLLQWRGAAEVGIYGAGYRLAMIMALLVAGFRFAWHPFFLSVAEQENIKKLFARVLTYFLLACALFYLFFDFYIDNLVHMQVGGKTLFAQPFWESTSIVPLIMLAYVMFGVYAIFVAGIHITKKTKFLPFITFCGAATNILGNWLLIPTWGMIGAAWATFISYTVMTSALYFVAQKYYPIEFEFQRIVKLVIIVLLIFNASRIALAPSAPIWLTKK